MTHRCGRIGPEDCQEEGAPFTLAWQGIDLFAQEPNKEEPTPLSMPFKEPMLFKEGATIQMQIVERNVAIKLGEIIRLSPKQ